MTDLFEELERWRSEPSASRRSWEIVADGRPYLELTEGARHSRLELRLIAVGGSYEDQMRAALPKMFHHLQVEYEYLAKWSKR